MLKVPMLSLLLDTFKFLLHRLTMRAVLQDEQTDLDIAWKLLKLP